MNRMYTVTRKIALLFFLFSLFILLLCNSFPHIGQRVLDYTRVFIYSFVDILSVISLVCIFIIIIFSIPDLLYLTFGKDDNIYNIFSKVLPITPKKYAKDRLSGYTFNKYLKYIIFKKLLPFTIIFLICELGLSKIWVQFLERVSNM